MREGVNPEKFKGEENNFYLHRIIIPIYIPNIIDEYYSESIKVLELCLNSIFITINLKTTAITIINNNSCEYVNDLLNENISKIDKIVNYSENMGKVYTVLSEGRASYEEFVTIVDADVVFFSGWETAVFNVFKAFPKAGVVAPLACQSLAFSNNVSVFFDNYFLNKIKYNKIVSDYDCDLYCKGLGNTWAHNRTNRKNSWREKQYFLQNKDTIAILGSCHFVATYRKDIFYQNKNFPRLKFLNGLEDKFIDYPADFYGWYRLSTSKNYAHHVGNKIDKFCSTIPHNSDTVLDPNLILNFKKPSKTIVNYKFKIVFFKILTKLINL